MATQIILVDELGLEFGNSYYLLEEGKNTEIKLYSTIPYHRLNEITFTFEPTGSVSMEEIPVSTTMIPRETYERTLLLSPNKPEIGDVTLTASCMRDYGPLKVSTLLKVEPVLVECPRPSRTFPMAASGLSAVLGFISFSKNSDASGIKDDLRLAQSQGASVADQEALIADYDDAIAARNLYVYLTIGGVFASGYLWYNYLDDKREYEACVTANEKNSVKPILKVSVLPVPQVSVHVRF